MLYWNAIFVLCVAHQITYVKYFIQSNWIKGYAIFQEYQVPKEEEFSVEAGDFVGFHYEDPERAFVTVVKGDKRPGKCVNCLMHLMFIVQLFKR